jgi:hypothetical protein
MTTHAAAEPYSEHFARAFGVELDRAGPRPQLVGT